MASVDLTSIAIMVAKIDFQPPIPASIVSTALSHNYHSSANNKIELDLPEYDSYESLRSQILTAITAGSSYFGFA